MKTIALNTPILDELTKRGHAIRKKLDTHHIFSLNIMASPGAGKTSLIMRTISLLKDIYKLAVIEGDVVPIDVEKVEKLGVPVILAQTGGSCHLDSIMMENAIKKLDLNAIDILIVENVGNLICPSNFYLGTHKNVVVASVPEGDDKPYKYPAMFKGADVVILNKSDFLDTEEFAIDSFEKGIRLLNKKVEIFTLSCKTGKNIPKWIDWVSRQHNKVKKQIAL
jgi:hydrogenase nickel incorporation protein HypB